jgi:thiamine-monophosphate kinase
VNEFELIERFFTRQVTDPEVLLGVGDDGAVVRPATGRDLVVVADSMVEGVHFPRQMDAADIAYRAVAVNLSDIAAMAARPRWMTLALTLAKADTDWLEKFADGLFEIGRVFDVALIGGDTTGGSQNVITVQIIGDIEPGTALRRSGARPGDDIFVTGTPGDAACGLALFQADAMHGDDAARLYKRFARPEPRLQFAAGLAALATAAIDVSDGLYADIGKLLTASSFGGCIDIDSLPLSASLMSMRDKDAAIEFSLSGGDDYEIAFTAPPGNIEFIRRLAENCALQVTRIGSVTTGGGLSCLRDGRSFDYRHTGYRHFE